MKKFVTRCLIFLLLILLVFGVAVLCGQINGAFSEDGQQDGYFIICKPDSAVNVRKKPNKDGSVVGWVMFGTFVNTDGKTKNGFVHVVDLAAETDEGWIHSGFLSWDRPRAETYTAEVWGGNVIARTCINGKRLCVLKDGKTVTVYAQCNEWAVTNKGYVMCDWLREVGE